MYSKSGLFRVGNPEIGISGLFVDPDPGINVSRSRTRILGYFTANLLNYGLFSPKFYKIVLSAIFNYNVDNSNPDLHPRIPGLP